MTEAPSLPISKQQQLELAIRDQLSTWLNPQEFENLEPLEILERVSGRAGHLRTLHHANSKITADALAVLHQCVKLLRHYTTAAGNRQQIPPREGFGYVQKAADVFRAAHEAGWQGADAYLAATEFKPDPLLPYMTEETHVDI